MKLPLLSRLFGDSEKFSRIYFLNTAPYEYFVVVCKRLYCRTSLREATRTTRMALSWKLIEDGIYGEGMIKAKHMETLKEARCFQEIACRSN